MTHMIYCDINHTFIISSQHLIYEMVQHFPSCLLPPHIYIIPEISHFYSV